MCMLAIMLFISVHVLETSPYKGGAAEIFTDSNFFRYKAVRLHHHHRYLVPTATSGIPYLII
jgi:hypothetical protein